jgi:hypothetical protein
MQSTMNVEEFTRRLEALCARGSGREWPRKLPDQHVLLKSVALLLDSQRDYDEQALNERLETWCEDVGHNIVTDYVAVRRYLVDLGYVQRDAAGHNYRLNPDKVSEQFDPAVDALDPAAIVAEAQRRAEERKRAYLAKARGDGE